jgi:hypothetical protein
VTTATTAVVQIPDASGLLAAALAAASSGYHFVTTVVVGADVALTAEGDRSGASTRMSVTSNDATVDWVITADGSWVAENGIWREIDQPAPVTDPLVSLAAPSKITVTGSDAADATLTATYPASDFGLPGDTPIDVTIDLAGGDLASLAYTAPGSDPPVTVTTLISAPTGTTPITAPSL